MVALAVCALGLAACRGAESPTSAAASPQATAAEAAQAAQSTQATATATTSTAATATQATSATSSPATSSAQSLAGKTVVIDPGHNGANASHAAQIAKLVPMGFGQYKTCDTTGTNAVDGYPEHLFTFEVSTLVQNLLEQRGIKVIMTRSNDDGVGPCVDQRAAIGNDAHADAAISIHGDGFDTSGHGFQIIQASRSAGGAANDARSNALSQALHSTFLSESGLAPSTYIGTDGYESRSDLAGLNLSTVPKVLVECGNMKNPGDDALMESSAGRARLAAAIADGIIDFLERGSTS